MLASQSLDIWTAILRAAVAFPGSLSTPGLGLVCWSNLSTELISELTLQYTMLPETQIEQLTGRLMSNSWGLLPGVFKETTLCA